MVKLKPSTIGWNSMDVFFYLIVPDLKRLDISFVMNGESYLCGSDSSESSYGQMCGSFHDRLDEAGFDRDDIFHKTGLTKVSKFLAFDQMPNLKIRIHKSMNN